MENATKALLIAAAILIAIVVITLGVFVLGKGSALVKENSDMSDVEITTYNSKFEGYCGKNIRGAQVRQLINAVNQHNRSNIDDSSKQIILALPSESLGTKAKTDYDTKKILTGKAYNVEPDYDTSGGGLMTSITITEQGN